MKITVKTEHNFALPSEATKQDILIIGEDSRGNMIIDYKGQKYTSMHSDPVDIEFSESIPLYERTHPDFDNASAFDEIKALLPQFSESSWHNDTCPSLHYWIDESLDYYIQVFIDYKDPSKRESNDLSMFCVSVNKGNEEVYQPTTINEVLNIVRGAINE